VPASQAETLADPATIIASKHVPDGTLPMFGTSGYAHERLAIRPSNVMEFRADSASLVTQVVSPIGAWYRTCTSKGQVPASRLFRARSYNG
jgi:hypothetical protein